MGGDLVDDRQRSLARQDAKPEGLGEESSYAFAAIRAEEMPGVSEVDAIDSVGRAIENAGRQSRNVVNDGICHASSKGTFLIYIREKHTFDDLQSRRAIAAAIRSARRDASRPLVESASAREPFSPFGRLAKALGRGLTT
jgi:hypothetical protein